MGAACEPKPATAARLVGRFGATAAVGCLGGGLFAWLGLPLAWLLGAMAATVALLPTRLPFYLPRPLHRGALVVIGVLLGSHFVPEALGRMVQWWPAVLLVLGFVIFTGAAGWAYFRRVAGYEPITALFCAAPAGLNIMLAYSELLGGNMARIALVHAMRVIAIVVAVPLVLLAYGIDVGDTVASRSEAAVGAGTASWLVLAGCALVGYFGGRRLPIPAGVVLGPLGLSALAHLLGLPPVAPPEALLAAIQVILGISVGLRLHNADLLAMADALFYGVVWAIVMLGCAMGLAWSAAQLGGFAFPALLLATTPGGLPEMSLVAVVVGIDVAFVVTCSLARFLVVVIAVPVLVQWIAPPETPSQPTVKR